MTDRAPAATRRSLVNLSVIGMSVAAFGGAWLGIVLSDTAGAQPAAAPTYAAAPASGATVYVPMQTTSAEGVTTRTLVPVQRTRVTVPTRRRSRAS